MMTRYSNPALWVRRRFFSSYNDVTIIVEDMGKENFYVNIFQRLLGDRVKIRQVNGVGGKTEVIRRFNARVPSPRQPEFFLVDGDFDELLGIQYPNDPHFYRLTRYDIETFLVEGDAICSVAEEESPSRSAKTYDIELQVQQWLSQILEISIRLSAASALWQELNITHPRFLQSIERHIPPSQTLPDRNSIQAYIDQMKMQQSVVSPAEFDHRLEVMIARMGDSNIERRKWVSGKHIVMPLTMRLLSPYVARKFDKDSLCFRLAIKCEFAELSELKNRILAVC